MHLPMVGPFYSGFLSGLPWAKRRVPKMMAEIAAVKMAMMKSGVQQIKKQTSKENPCWYFFGFAQ